MPRDVTVSFDDGSSHIYQGAPDDITPEQAQARAEKEFSKKVVHLDGGKKPAEQGAVSKYLDWYGNVAEGVGEGAVDMVKGISQAVTHPVETAKGLYHAVTNPLETAENIGKGVIEEASGVTTGKGLGKAAFDVASMAMGGGEAKKAADIALGGREAEKVISKALPETYKHHEIAADVAKLPKSDSVATAAGQDLQSTLRDKATRKHDDLRSTQKTAGDQAFENYRSSAAKQEATGNYFSVSKSGDKLISKLVEIESGGKGVTTEYRAAMQKRAKKLREALTGGGKPANIDVSDNTLRELRHDQHNTGIGGYSSVKRAEIKRLADDLEAAMKDWVGEENYPRGHYEAMSQDLNKWNSRLGQALRNKENIKYVKEGESGYATRSDLASRSFSNADNVKELRSLLGEQDFNEVAARHVSNEFRGKTAEQAAKWVDEAQWLKTTPELKAKAVEYVRIMAEREGKPNVLSWVKKNRGKLALGAAGFVGYENRDKIGLGDHGN